jgi:hypothetical protein
MFPLSVINYVKIGLVVVLLCGAGYIGYALEAARFDRYVARQQAATQKAQEEHQAAADKIRKEKDAQIASINNQLADALIGLRERPNRTQAAGNGQGAQFCTGAQLYAEDAGLALREAARADTIREALKACYLQYDTLK